MTATDTPAECEEDAGEPEEEFDSLTDYTARELEQIYWDDRSDRNRSKKTTMGIIMHWLGWAILIALAFAIIYYNIKHRQESRQRIEKERAGHGIFTERFISE